GRGWKGLWKIQLSESFPRRPSRERALENQAMVGGINGNGPAALERPGPGAGKKLRCEASVCKASRRSRSRSRCFERQASRGERAINGVFRAGRVTRVPASDLRVESGSVPREPASRLRLRLLDLGHCDVELADCAGRQSAHARV